MIPENSEKRSVFGDLFIRSELCWEALIIKKVFSVSLLTLLLWSCIGGNEPLKGINFIQPYVQPGDPSTVLKERDMHEGIQITETLVWIQGYPVEDAEGRRYSAASYMVRNSNIPIITYTTADGLNVLDELTISFSMEDEDGLASRGE